MKQFKSLLTLLILLAFIAITALIFLFKPTAEHKEPERSVPALRVIIVEPEKVPLSVLSQGTVSPRTETALSAEVMGQVIEVSPAFKNGGFFEQGDLLLKIDPTDYQANLASARAELAQAELNLSREKAAAEQARNDWERLGKGEASGLTLRQPQLTQAKAALESARASVIRAEYDFERTEVRAPYGGRILKKHVDLGQYLNGPGMTLATIYSTDYAEIRLPITDREMSLLTLPEEYRGEGNEKRVGPEVSIRSQVGSDQYTWKGVIDRSEGTIDTQTRLQYVVARVDDPYARAEDTSRPPLKIGMFVEAVIAGDVLEQAYVLPRSALAEEGLILVVDEEDKLRKRSINTAYTDAEKIVVDAGLNPGDRVCITPLGYVIEGMRVSVE